MIENEQEHQEVITQGPGQILKQARELANLTSQDIADKMKLRKSLVEDIEQDNYDINISLTFIRGYLKLYAKHVKVDETEILNAFESLSTQKKEPAKLQSFSRRIANQANDDKLMLVTYLVVAVVIALVVIWWFQQASSETTSPANVSSYSEPLTSNDATQNNAIQSDVIQEAVSEVATPQELPIEETPTLDVDTLMTVVDPLEENERVIGLDVLTTEVQFQSDIAEQTIDNLATEAETLVARNNDEDLADVLPTDVSETAAPVELIFEFSGDCWMNLADATGENIAYGVKVKGRVMPVTGIPPFVVTLGAPEVVQIRYAGEPLDMSFLPSGRIAKFDLPLTE